MGESRRTLTSDEGFFLDTYAMVEYLRGNKRYASLVSSDGRRATSVMNLVELYYLVLRERGNEREADTALAAFGQFEIHVTAEDIRNGMKMRLSARARKTDFSYADAIGYAMSGRLGMRYLTGDDAFKGLPNVEFVK
jgi:predicted nucleic acid-binding protein